MDSITKSNKIFCVYFQQYSRDDTAIGAKDETRQIKCESSPPTPRSLRLERVAAALAKSQSDTVRYLEKNDSC